MAFWHRWTDKLLSQWFLKEFLWHEAIGSSNRSKLTLHLSLTDAYSYLASQLLTQIDDIIEDQLKPIHIVVHSPNIPQAHQTYQLEDAIVLAQQHRFTQPLVPNTQFEKDIDVAWWSIQKLAQSTPHDTNTHQMLASLFDLLWQHESKKLRILFQRITLQTHHRQGTLSVLPTLKVSDTPLDCSYFEFKGQKYSAIDDLLRLMRRLHKQQFLLREPVFLTDHVEWGEHLVSDPWVLNKIQATKPHLTIYIPLEDPVSWIIVNYIQQVISGYYKVKLDIKPVSYQSNHVFDWRLLSRLATRTKTPFAPFVRPNEQAVTFINTLLYATPTKYRVEIALAVFKAVWSEAQDMSYQPHQKNLLKKLSEQHEYIAAHFNFDVLQEESFIQQGLAWKQEHDIEAKATKQPFWPIFILTVDQQSYQFCSLYRVWRIETILSKWIDDKNT